MRRCVDLARLGRPSSAIVRTSVEIAADGSSTPDTGITPTIRGARGGLTTEWLGESGGPATSGSRRCIKPLEPSVHPRAARDSGRTHTAQRDANRDDHRLVPSRYRREHTSDQHKAAQRRRQAGLQPCEGWQPALEPSCAAVGSPRLGAVGKRLSADARGVPAPVVGRRAAVGGAREYHTPHFSPLPSCGPTRPRRRRSRQ